MASSFPIRAHLRNLEPIARKTTTQNSQHAARRPFSVCARCQSKIGRKVISIPPEVTFQIMPPVQSKKRRIVVSSTMLAEQQKSQMSTVNIKGPLGELNYPVPPFVTLSRQGGEAGPVAVTIEDPEIKHQREMWGTVRADLANHVLGVSEGHTAILRLVGVGYRASIETTATTNSPTYEGQKFVNLKVGYSHPIELGIPKGVTASTPQPTRLLLEGPEKEVVMEFAAKVRAWRVPEPYKGKGIFVNGETIKLKNKKIK